MSKRDQTVNNQQKLTTNNYVIRELSYLFYNFKKKEKTTSAYDTFISFYFVICI